MNPTIEIVLSNHYVTIVLTADRRTVSIIRPRGEFFVKELACDCYTDFIQPRWALVPGTTPDGGTGPYFAECTETNFRLIDSQDDEQVFQVPFPSHDRPAIEGFCISVGRTRFHTEKPSELKYGGFQSIA